MIANDCKKLQKNGRKLPCRFFGNIIQSYSTEIRASAKASVCKRNACRVGGIAVLLNEVEYALDKSPDLHRKCADTEGEDGYEKLRERFLCESEVEVMNTETAEENSEQSCGES